MKKILLLILVIVFLIATIPAATPLHRLYQADDEEFEKTVRLCIAGGVIFPNVAPATGGMLIDALESIPPILSETAEAEKQELLSQLKGSDDLYSGNIAGINFDIYGGVNALLHPEIYNYEFFVPHKDLDPMIAGLLEVSFAENAELYMEFIEKDRLFNLADKMNHYTNTSAVLAFTNDGVSFFNGNFMTQAYQPFLAGVSAGNNWFNFQLGRNRQRYGSGVTGNLVINDNFSYEEYMRLSFTSDIFSYFLDVTYFGQQIDSLTFETFRFSGMHQFRTIHRFQLHLFDKLTISFDIGSMFQTDSAFDFRMFIPMMIPHAFYNFSEEFDTAPGDETNNIMALDIMWSFLPGWSLDLQIVADQIQMPRERDNFMPSAYGFLANVRNVTEIGNGFLSSYFEAVYTMPYLYLNRKFTKAKIDYNYDWIVGNHFTAGNEIQYSGYPYGPDSLVFSIGSEYYSSFGLSGGLSITFIMHGNHGIKFDEATSDVIEENWRDVKSIFEYTLSPELFIDYTFLNSHLSVGIEAALPYKWNYQHKVGAERFIPQASVYFRYSIL